MRQRGYTVIELLVAMGLLVTVMGLVFVGVRPQVQHAGAITRSARMQSEARAAFDLMARDIRMAGYGVDLTMPGVPAPAIHGSEITYWGNFTNVRTTGSGAGSIVQVANSAGFAPGNFLVISSTLFGGEARPIAGVADDITVVLASPLSRAYAAGSPVHQVEPVRYLHTGELLTRNGQAALTGLLSSSIQYFLQDGSQVTTPPAQLGSMRTALVTLNAAPSDRPDGAAYDDLNIAAEVRIRNLGLVNAARP